MKNICFLLALMLLSTPSLAASVWHTSKISHVYPISSGDFIIIFENTSQDCTRSDNYFYVEANQNGVTPEGRDKMFSTVLSAALAGKEITINFDSSSDKCHVNRLYIRI